MIPTVRLIAIFLFICTASCTFPDPYCKNEVCLAASLDDGDVDFRVLLVGDAGANIGGNDYDRPVRIPFFMAIKNYAELIPDRTVVVFLGDNIYSKGLPDADERPRESDENCEGRACAEKRIDVQIDVLKKSKARGIFVPGNHDWDDSGKRGWRRIRNLDKYLKNSRKEKKADVVLIPENGCPGPVTVSLSGKKVEISLIALDTQWWLHEYEKPGKDGNLSGCEQVTENGVVQSLKEQIADGQKKNKRILLVAHHPLMTNGSHSGFYSVQDLVNPAYFFSQLVKKTGWLDRQDLNHSVYREMRRKIHGAIHESVRKGDAPVIYAAGHDHSLQAISDEVGIHYLISGAGSPWMATRVGHKNATLFSHSNKTGGFMAVDFLQSKKVRLAVIEPRSSKDECKKNEGKGCVVFSTWIE